MPAAAYEVRDEALGRAALVRARDAVFASGALGDNPLAGTFASTRGFGLLFTERERDALEARHAWARAFLALALDGAPAGYACYLNALLVPPGGGVGRHVDGTLQEPLGEPAALPADVTVLYLAVPDATGGELVLSPPGDEPAVIAPRARRLVRFAGHLPHEVRPLAPDAGQPRLSLVLERYHPRAEALRRFTPRLVPAPPVVDVAPLFAGARPRSFSSLVRRP